MVVFSFVVNKVDGTSLIVSEFFSSANVFYRSGKENVAVPLYFTAVANILIVGLGVRILR